jgi:uncharacterized protein (DUF2249 family)
MKSMTTAELLPPTTPEMGPDKVLDVRPIPCSTKHGLILRTWIALPVGDHFILLNGHDPIPLFYQFSAQWPGTFTWEHLANSPGECRVKITKLRSLATGLENAPTCCSGH